MFIVEVRSIREFRRFEQAMMKAATRTATIRTTINIIRINFRSCELFQELLVLGKTLSLAGDGALHDSRGGPHRFLLPALIYCPNEKVIMN